MLRIDRSVTPTMAKAPTLGLWELDRLRSIEQVVRLGRVRVAQRGRLDLDEGSVDAGRRRAGRELCRRRLKNRPLVPIWGAETITLQPVRAGFPCFGAALAGYIEATRDDDDEKNRLCPPSSYGNSLTEWARMNVRGTRNTAAFSAEPDIKEWADRVALNRPGSRPSRRVRPTWTRRWVGWAAISSLRRPVWPSWPADRGVRQMSWSEEHSGQWWQVLGSNQRRRAGRFTVCSLWPLGQPAMRDNPQRRGWEKQ